MKKYVAYCRSRCAPRISEAASSLLSGQYVHIRHRVRESLANRPDQTPVVPITVRQLEALIRMSESLAKMRLAAETTPADVEEAIRLFRVSTLAASEANQSSLASSGAVVDGQNRRNSNSNPNHNPGNAMLEIKRVEDYFKRRIGLKMTVHAQKLQEEALAQGFGIESINRAIAAMILRQELQELNQRRFLRRIR